MTGAPIAHFVNGAKVAGAGSRWGDVFNPATGDVSGRVPLASKAEVDAVVDAAAAAFPAWAATPPLRARTRHVSLPAIARSQHGSPCRDHYGGARKNPVGLQG